MQTSSPTQSRPSSEETNTSSGYGTTPQSSSSNGKRMGGKKCQEKKLFYFYRMCSFFWSTWCDPFLDFLRRRRWWYQSEVKKKVWPKILDTHDRHSKITLFLPFIVWKWNGSRASKWWKKAKINKIVRNFFLRTLQQGPCREMSSQSNGETKKDQSSSSSCSWFTFFAFEKFRFNAGLKKAVEWVSNFFSKAKKNLGKRFFADKIKSWTCQNCVWVWKEIVRKRRK